MGRRRALYPPMPAWSTGRFRSKAPLPERSPPAPSTAPVIARAILTKLPYPFRQHRSPRIDRTLKLSAFSELEKRDHRRIAHGGVLPAESKSAGFPVHPKGRDVIPSLIAAIEIAARGI